MLDKFWEKHPDMYLCGLVKGIEGCSLIPFDVDPKDWIGIAHKAVNYLIERGYNYCYLIIDDHPPFATCNGDYLSEELPRLAHSLKAICVSLVGWDQIRAYQGFKLGSGKHFWLNNDPAYRWSFNLHPACWNTTALKEILEIVMTLEGSDRSARNFEASMHSPVTPIPEHYRRNVYRVCGDRFAISDKWFGNRMFRKGILKILHGVRLSAKGLGGASVLNRVDAQLRVYTDYLNGPYPMFWSGLMQKGATHENAIRFLKLTGQHEFARIASTL